MESMCCIPSENCIHCTTKKKLTIIHDRQRAWTDLDVHSALAMHDIAPMLVGTAAWREQILASLRHDEWIYSGKY